MSKALAPSTPANNINETLTKQGITVPQVPVSPQQLEKFEIDMNTFIEETTSKRVEELEKY